MEICNVPIKVKIKKKIKTSNLKKHNAISKKVVPAHCQYGSKYVSSSRITTKIGLYNHGKISDLVTRHENNNASERMKARVQEDLHKILNLDNYQKPKTLQETLIDVCEEDFLTTSKNISLKQNSCPSSPLKRHSRENSLSTSTVLDSPSAKKIKIRKEPLHPLENLVSNSLCKTNVTPEEILPCSSTSHFSSGTVSITKLSPYKSTKLAVPEISDFVENCVYMWSSRLDQLNMRHNLEETEKNSDNKNVDDSRSNYLTKKGSTEAIKFLSTSKQDISISSCGNIPSVHSVCNKSNQDYSVDSLLDKSGLSDTSLSSLNPLDEFVLGLTEDELLWLKSKNNNNLVYSPDEPPIISPLKRPHGSSDTPKLFYRHKMY